ncbi:MAG: hypothetical protein Q8O13_01295 [Candidatus Omnitrophota bacterium]|nr:hypothetical protein [Candidatus Omnitrophota bacterium]
MIKQKRNKKIGLFIFFIAFVFCSSAYSRDEKEDMKQYIAKINPVLINVQMTSRNISQKLLSLEAAVKQMREYLAQLQVIKPPDFMAKQHKMILLSFKKMKAGFYLLSKGDRSSSIPLVKKGAALLRIAAKDIVDFAKKQGLIKEKNK